MKWCRAARATCLASTARSRTASRACRKSPRSASTFFISRRSIRSAAPTARARTTRSRPSPATSAASMRSATKMAATTPSNRRSARSRISARWSRPATSTSMEVAMDIAVQCSPDHPWLKEHPEWFKQAAGRHHQICREPAEEIRRHRQPGLRLRRPHRPMDGIARCAAVLGRSGRAHFPHRQSAHQAACRSGNGRSARCRRAIRA